MGKNKLRVLVTAHSFIEKSGVDNYLQNLFNSLSVLAPSIEYVFVGNKRSKDYFKFDNPNIIIAYPSLLLDSQIGKILWYIFFVSRFSKKNKISVIFNSSATNTFIPTKKVPVISCVHDLAEFQIINKYSILRMFYRKNISMPLNKLFTKHFICVSNSTKKDLQRFMHIDEKCISVVFNGADHIQKTLKVNNQIKNSDRYLLYVGRLDPYGKNVLRLIEAFNEIKYKYDELKLFLVGNKARGSEIIYKYVEENRLEEKVKFLGYVKDEDLPEIYKNALIFIFPSLYEGFGFPILEAMMYGVPVICSNTSSLPEVGGEAALYFNPENVDDIKNSIEKLLTDNDLRKELPSRGMIRYKQFTWLDSAEKTLRIIKNLLELNET